MAPPARRYARTPRPSTRAGRAAAALVVAAAIGACRATDDGPAAGGTAPATRSDGPVRVPIQLDDRRQQLAGVRTARAERREVSADVRAAGVVAYADTAVVDVSTKVGGWVKDLAVGATGMRVRTGDRLFVLDSPELLAAENELIAALRGRLHAAQSTVPETREQVEQVIEIARTRLLRWNVSVNEVRELERRGRALGEMTFLSPATGTVLVKDVVEGMHVEAGQRLFRVVDLSSVWIEAAVSERDIGAVRTGQAAAVRMDAYPGETRRGRVTSVSPTLSGETRTVGVRVTLDNRDGRLRPGMFATVTIAGTPRTTLTVPADAVIDSGTDQVVFLAERDGRFEPRRVTTGQRIGDRVEILDGVADGQLVVSGATFLLDSESQMRAALESYAGQPGGPPAPTAGHAAATAPIAMTVRFRPDPPRVGTATIDATLTGPDGALEGAEVRAVLSMPAMPSMGMGPMRADSRLALTGPGTYSGTVEIAHAGRWDVQVTASRGGRTVASRELAVVVR